MTGLLILRPRPGADATAARARAMGLDPVVAPLFTIEARPWTRPAGAFDAVMLTSANAPRLAGDGMTPFLDLPCYAVGEATAEVARMVGFADVRMGPADGAALVATMAGDGIGAALHLCGEDRSALPEESLHIVRHVPVYAAVPADELPAPAKAALSENALALLHSPRAASLFAGLAAPDRPRTRIAAISAAAADAAGPGWASIAVADRPRDEALLELAVKLCQTGRR